MSKFREARVFIDGLMYAPPDVRSGGPATEYSEFARGYYLALADVINAMDDIEQHYKEGVPNE